MFFFKSKKLEGQGLVDAVKTLQDENISSTIKNKSFADLRDTFGGLIGNKIKSVIGIASDQKERKEIRHHVESQFLETLLELTPESAPRIVSYVAKAFSTKINKHSISILLGKTEILGDVAQYKIRFKNALKTFYKKFKRMPDFNKIDLDKPDESDDLEKFSEILKTPVEKTMEILRLFSQGLIKSMFEEISGEGDDGEAGLLLGDTLRSNEPLPDEVLKDNEIKRLLIKEINKLPEREKKVLMLYYHPDNPEAEELTSDEIAAKTNESERNVRHWIAIGREKLRESKPLKEYYSTCMFKQFVKYAMLKYHSGTQEDMIFEVVAKCQK